MDLSTITPLLITYNEESNLPRVLSRLAWATQIIVVDSGSSDRTLSLLSAVPMAQVVTRRFDSFAEQTNFGVSLVQTPWVLSLDADYVLSDGFEDELSKLQLTDQVTGFEARFVYCVNGVPLRGTLYPPRVVLHRRAGATYVNEGHAHRLVRAGRVRKLRTPIRHDDRKPLSRWLASQDRYSEIEACALDDAAWSTLSIQDRVRRLIVVAPFAVLFYTLIIRGLWRDGWSGVVYVTQRVVAELILSIKLAERRSKHH